MLPFYHGGPRGCANLVAQARAGELRVAEATVRDHAHAVLEPRLVAQVVLHRHLNTVPPPRVPRCKSCESLR
jgi:hypothetical protein